MGTVSLYKTNYFRRISLCLTLMCFLSCSDDHTKSVTERTNSLAGDENEKVDLPSYLSKIPEQQLPYKDSLVWELSAATQIPGSIVETLKLKEIVTSRNKWDTTGSKFFYRYQLKFSENYFSLVLCWVWSDNQQLNYLINFDGDFKVIDHLCISDDESAESAFYSWSMVYWDSIVSHDFNYFESSETISQYEILEDGHFKKLGEEKIITERQNCDYGNGISEESSGIVVCPRQIEIYDDSLLQRKYLYWDLSKRVEPDKFACATFYKPDYGIVHYECLESADKFYKIRINKTDIKFLPKKNGYIYYTWMEYIGGSVGGIRLIDKEVWLYEKPSEQSNSLMQIEGTSFCALEMKGDWLKVQVHCFQDSNENPQLGAPCTTYTAVCAANKTGWIRWREGDKLLIEIHQLL